MCRWCALSWEDGIVARPSETGSRASTKPASGLGPLGFDPAREDKPYSFDEIAEPILRAIRFAYKLERRNKGRSIPWRGPPIGRNEAACSPDFKERLRAGNLAYADEDQGRDALEEIVGVALQLGIEQGRRITMTGPVVKTLRLELRLAELMRDRDTDAKRQDGETRLGPKDGGAVAKPIARDAA